MFAVVKQVHDVKMWNFVLYFRLCGVSKLLDGIWSPSADDLDSATCCDGGHSLFELFRDGDSEKLGRSASEECRTKYYTPFGSGISLSSLTGSPLPETSCWNSEPTASHKGETVKPAQATCNINKLNANKFHSATKLPDFGVKTASKNTEGRSPATVLGCPLEQMKSNQPTDKMLTSVLTRGDQPQDVISHQNLYASVLNRRDGKTVSPKLPDVPRDVGRYSVAGQQEKQLLATQQMFMQELNRLPPDLRKQYVDYMIASHHGLLPAACQPMPSMYYGVAVGSGVVPVMPLFAPPLVVPAGALVPASLVAVAPSTVAKSVSR